MQGRGAAIGPDLGNLIHRDYASVLRDLRNPGFAINPDYVGQTVVLKDGRVLTGVLQTRGDRMLLGDAQGRQTELRTDEIEQMQPATTSVMPQGIVEKLSAEDLRDLLTYLMTPAPRMPLDSHCLLHRCERSPRLQRCWRAVAVWTSCGRCGLCRSCWWTV